MIYLLQRNFGDKWVDRKNIGALEINDVQAALKLVFGDESVQKYMEENPSYKGLTPYTIASVLRIEGGSAAAGARRSKRALAPTDDRSGRAERGEEKRHKKEKVRARQ